MTDPYYIEITAAFDLGARPGDIAYQRSWIPYFYAEWPDYFWTVVLGHAGCMQAEMAAFVGEEFVLAQVRWFVNLPFALPIIPEADHG